MPKTKVKPKKPVPDPITPSFTKVPRGHWYPGKIKPKAAS